MTYLCPNKLTFPWQPYFDTHVFRNFHFLAFLIRIFPFSLQFSHFCIILAPIRSHNRGRRPQARGPRKTIEKDKCAIFSENCATLNVINSRGYTQICVGLGDSFKLGSKLDYMLSTKALIKLSL